MKNVSLALTLGILLISAAILGTTAKNIVAQTETTDDTMTEEQIQAKITEFKLKHPIYAAIVEAIPLLDLKETVKNYIAAGSVQKLLKYHAKNLVEENVTTNQTNSSPVEETMTDEQIQAKATEIITKHPRFAAVVEGISNLDLKQTFKGYLGAEVLQKLLKYHAKNLVEEKVANATSQ